MGVPFSAVYRLGWFLCHQFETDANWKIHEATTGPEILNDLATVDTKLDYWVTGYGTGGTFHGTNRTPKKRLATVHDP